MGQGTIIIISGPSGSGKTTLYKKLLASPRFKGRLVKSISATTRAPRGNEVNGRDYLFFSKKQFLHKRRAGHFLESQKVFDNYYGTPRKNVEDILKSGKSVLLCIDVKGAKVVCRKCRGVKKVFIKTPSLAVLKKRLSKRGSESQKVVNLRLKTAQKELLEAKYYDYIVINDILSKAYQRLENIIAGILS